MIIIQSRKNPAYSVTVYPIADYGDGNGYFFHETGKDSALSVDEMKAKHQGLVVSELKPLAENARKGLVYSRADILSAWLEVFPNSHARVSAGIYGGLHFVGTIQAKNEWENGIMENDPLRYTAWLEGENWEETALGLSVKPSPGSYLYCETVRLRKQTIKQVSREKLVKRFQKIKAFIQENKDNCIKDINGKV